MSKTAFRGLLLIVLCGAALLRVPGLSLRPMHHDEANQALKFGLLLEKGEYRYDKADHHGPTLYYLTLPLAWASAKTTLASLDETTLRLLPVLFGLGLIPLLVLFGKDIGRPAVLFAGLFAALSPAFAYYSRFYIQETLFVFFIAGFLGSLWRFISRPSSGWAVAAGFFGGMMFATKETSVVVFAATAGALVLTNLTAKKEAMPPAANPGIRALHIGLFAAAAGVTAALFYSSFFTNPKGVVDSVLAFQTYFAKGGTPGLHGHPWWYYLGLLTRVKSGGLAWSEALVLALACLGFLAAALKRDRFAIFISFYALITAAVFSLIPYKTPWNLLPFHLGFVILAGIGTVFMFRSLRERYQKILAGILLAIGLFQLGWQSYQANFRYYADPRNPYVYAQTSTDYLKLVRRVDEIASLHPDHERMPIKVVCDPSETWPLPWSLRRFERVGYWTNWQDWRAAASFEDAPIVIASRDQAERIQPLIQSRYQSEYYGLRPDVLLMIFIRNDLWDHLLKNKAAFE
ncbi:MAG: flippase activity-associated protein Agl23 [Candidatus Aminicenantales bacterium]